MSAGDVDPVPRVRPAEDGTQRDVLTGLLDFLPTGLAKAMAAAVR